MNNLRKAVAMLLLLCFGAFAAPATTIVAVRTKSEIWIGADSKVTDTFGNERESRPCKIVAAAGVHFAYAGFARNAKTGFSVPQAAAAALAEEPTSAPTRKAEILGIRLGEKLESEIRGIRETDFVTYREKIEGKTFLRILVAGFEKGKPVLLVRQFRFGQKADGGIGVIVSNDDCGTGCKDKIATRFLGETAAIDGLPEETRDFWKPGYAAGVRKLIELQIAAREDYVGPPIDIIRLTSKRASWVQRKPEC